MLKIISIGLYLLFFFVFEAFYTVSPALAYFEENFNGSFNNSSSWNVNNSVGMTFSPTSMNLASSSPTQFPYVQSSEPIISDTDDFIEIKFRYISTGANFGNGFAITDNNPSPGTVMLYPSVFSQNTIFYVWQGPASPYLHVVTFLCPISQANCSGDNPTIVYQSTSQDLNEHVVRIQKFGNTYSFFLDDVNYFNSAPTFRIAKNVWFGHPEQTESSGTWSSFSIDYLKIGILSPSPFPSVIPSASPTSTPTPSSTFPYFSQQNSLWTNLLYDHANEWAESGKRGIGRWGCALTSAAMVLNKYDIKSTTGLPTTPAILNSWLRSQPDGYLGNGLLNWLAVSRYTRNSRIAGRSSIDLEFSKDLFDPIAVDKHISEGKSPILGMPGHFILAYASEGNSYKINDPANPSHTYINKSDELITSNVFTPSHTDLSYMLYAYDPILDFELFDSNGSPVEGILTEEYLKDEISGFKGKSLKLFYVPKPYNGDYIVKIANQSQSAAKTDVYFYDTQGNAWIKKLSISDNTQIELDFRYNRNKISKNKMNHDRHNVWRYIHSFRRWIPFWYSARWWERD